MTPLKDAIERLIRTTVQVVAGAVLAYVADKGWDGIDWSIVWKTAAFAALVCVLTAAAGARTAAKTDTSFVSKP